MTEHDLQRVLTEREAQGLPRFIDDPEVLRRLALIVDTRPAVAR